MPNVLLKSVYDDLAEGVKTELEETAVTLKGVTGEAFEPAGCATIYYEDVHRKVHPLECQVVADSDIALPRGVVALLGNKWATAMGALIDYESGVVRSRGHLLVTRHQDNGIKRTSGEPNPIYVIMQSDEELPPASGGFVKVTLKDEVPAGGTRALLIQGRHVEGTTTVLECVMNIPGQDEPSICIPITNHARHPVTLPKGSVLTVAEPMSEEQLLTMVADDAIVPDRSAAMQVLSVYTMVTEAAERAEEEDGESDPLEDELLFYDPTNIAQEEVRYDSERLRKLLKALKVEDWKLSTPQRHRAEKILAEHQAAFNLLGEPLGCTSLVEHKIDVTCDHPVREKLRFTPYHARESVEGELESLIKQGQIQPSSSPWNSPIVLVRRKNGKPRLCIDYRGLNKVTSPTWFPLPLIEDILYTSSSARVFSTLDLRSGYHQIGMDPDSVEKTAFSTHLGQFVYKRMPFGLAGAPATFQRLMTQVFAGLLGKGVQVFLDDICVASDSVEEHLAAVENVLKRLVGANLQASPEKTYLFQNEVTLLGHRVGGGTVRPVEEKMAVIKAYPQPRTKKEVQSFLGLASYYRKFIRGFAEIARPLIKLTLNDAKFEWTSAQTDAFNELRKRLTEDPILRAPDFEKPWIVYSDASDTSVGAVLSQEHGKHHLPVTYFSRVLRGAELRYNTVEKEALAIVEALKKFKPLIYGQQVTVFTDNQALRWLFANASDKSHRIARWGLVCQTYNAEVRYVPGHKNAVADSLSRIEKLELYNTMESGTDFEIDELAVQFINVILDTDVRIVGHIDSEEAGATSLEDIEEDEGPQWCPEEMVRSQARDELYGPLVLYLKSQEEADWELVDGRLRKEATSYFLDNGLLYKRHQWGGAELRGEEELLVIPAAMRNRALRLTHSSITAGHGAVPRTLFRTRRLFYWHGMHRDIKKFCQSCLLCARMKGRRHPVVPIGRFPIPEEPFASLAMDLIGPLQVTEAGNKYILNVVCFLTRYAVVAPLKSKHAEDVAQALRDHVIGHYGPPKMILSDNGREFRNEVVQRLATRMGVRLANTTIYHPSSNGLVERSNAQVQMILRGLIESLGADWDSCLKIAQLAMNSAYNRQLGDSPFFIVHRRDPIFPEAAWVGSSSKYNPDLEAAATQKIYAYVRQKLSAAADYQCRAKGPPFTPELSEGQRVFVKRIRKKGESKLAPKWEGPFRVIENVRPYVYKLRPINGGKVVKVHRDNVKSLALEANISSKEVPVARAVYPSVVSGSVCDELQSEFSGAEDDDSGAVPAMDPNVCNDGHAGPSSSVQGGSVARAQDTQTTRNQPAEHAASERMGVNEDDRVSPTGRRTRGRKQEPGYFKKLHQGTL